MSSATLLFHAQRLLRGIGVLILGRFVVAQPVLLPVAAPVAICAIALVLTRVVHAAVRPEQISETMIAVELALVVAPLAALLMLRYWIAAGMLFAFWLCETHVVHPFFPRASRSLLLRFVNSGVTVPFLGVSVAASGITGLAQSVPLLLFTVPLAAIEIADPAMPSVDDSLSPKSIEPASHSGPCRATLSLAGVTIATAVAVWGAPVALVIDRTLLAGTPAALLLLFGWLSLLDPGKQRRMIRIAALSRIAALVLVGLLIVMHVV